MDTLKEGDWFSEINTQWPGQAQSLHITKILCREQTAYQSLAVVETATFGRALILDGVIQCTQRDEFAYQEMIAHLPLYSHPCPRRVLVVGGGDGGVLREIVKHDCVESVVLCEIDAGVIEASKTLLPFMANGAFEHPKVVVHVGDGVAYVKDHRNEFDVIITDSSDPVGPAQALFEQPFYSLLKDALRDGGVLCAQGECIWLHLDLIRAMVSFCRQLFPSVAYAVASVPTYPCGQIGLLLCSKSGDLRLAKPARAPTSEDLLRLGLRYYNAAVHEAAFVLPQFAAAALAP